jgi:hypothetical protein
MYKNDKRKQIMYQKTEFNNSSICQLSNIFRCNRCKKNNTIQTNTNVFQLCLFCGNPNYIANTKIQR